MIRDACAEDCSAIAAIWNPVIRDTLITFTTEEKTAPDLVATLAGKERSGQPFLLACAKGELLGFATYGAFRPGPGYAHTAEHTVILAPRAWGRGVGRALMQAVEDHARRSGIHSLIGGVSGANTEGRAFHAALGYREIAILPEVGRKFGQWLDLVLMQKML
ncbi:GNAT family N-acetyltransferase [Plastorhodobacter daqingensis]|uniref:GNAT family N-acetyltransferase n=1 Tax=Plastorhodobacter daqingensis TaxID=1387281 RepID=A0ABW2UPB6_9RHOB